jgi:hypothetical protein
MRLRWEREPVADDDRQGRGSFQEAARDGEEFFGNDGKAGM